MALIAALVSDLNDRAALREAVPGNGLLWASSWPELDALTRDRAVAAVIAETGAVPRKDGVLRVFRHIERYPRTPILAWAPRTTRDLFRLGKAGANAVVLEHETRDPSLIGSYLDDLMARSAPETIRVRLEGHLPASATTVVQETIAGVASGARVRDLADAQGLSVSTLERRMNDWGMPTPGRLLLWLRVLHGLYWIREPGRSVESVARQLGYSSGPAFKRAVLAALGSMPVRIRAGQLFDTAVEALITECAAGDPVDRTRI